MTQCDSSTWSANERRMVQCARGETHEGKHVYGTLTWDICKPWPEAKSLPIEERVTELEDSYLGLSAELSQLLEDRRARLKADKLAAENIPFGYKLAPEIPEPIPMLLVCPSCGERHIDAGVFATKSHHTHACQYCGMVWRPAIVPTTGVRFLPGFKEDYTLESLSKKREEK
jgi:hypothetical protein